MKKKYLGPQSICASYTGLVSMSEDMSAMGSGDGGALTPKTAPQVKTA